MSMGDRIRRRRQELGMSVEAVARALGKNRATVYRYERGDIEQLPMGVLEPLSRVLCTTPAYLAGWSEETEAGEGLLRVRRRRVPLVGAIGGPSNVVYCKKISDYARLKYQKRYLLQKGNIVDVKETL